MAALPIPKKSLKERLADKEIDLIQSSETRSFKDQKRIQKERLRKIKSMSEEKKQELKDFIFGKIDENPLKDK